MGRPGLILSSHLVIQWEACQKKFYVQVLIVGGGDGGVAREVAKHPDVESIVQVEIDSHVLDVSKKFLPFMGAGLTNPKLTLHVGDGFRFMAQHRQEFDVIITDSSDPVGMYMIYQTHVCTCLSCSKIFIS
jgi:spermidine synthase